MSYNSGNLNYAFNVEYYSMTPEAANRDIVEITTPKIVCYSTEQSFELQTCYPGLMIGIGNFHGAAQKGELNGGFSLDYVTGAPYIPASSLKGVLRSAFEHEEYIREALGDNSVDVKALVDEIFQGTRNGKEIPMYERDIFFDAYPETGGNIVGIESITPHADEFKSPNPLSFLKVLPRVVFKFSFKLHDSEVYKWITADKKRELFKAIIKDFGLGAKTNVGFGAFEKRKEKEITQIECACGALNYKYEKGTKKIRWNWEKKVCYKCKEKLG